MSHGGRRFLVAAGDPFGGLVGAVSGEGLLQAAEAGTGVGKDVIEIQRFEHVDHEIGAGARLSEDVEFRRRADFGFRRQGRRRRIASFDLLRA